MKHRIVTTFLFLALLGASFSQVSASEVTGTLSSGGNGNGQQQNNTTGAHSSGPNSTSDTPDNGIIAGNVTGGTSEEEGGSGATGGNESGGEGAVLGETMAAQKTSETSSPSSYSSPGPAQGSSATSAPAVDSERGVSKEFILAQAYDDDSVFAYESSPQVATAFGAFSQFSAANWFWIILLLFILGTVITYIYVEDKRAESGRLDI